MGNKIPSTPNRRNTKILIKQKKKTQRTNNQRTNYEFNKYYLYAKKNRKIETISRFFVHSYTIIKLAKP